MTALLWVSFGVALSSGLVHGVIGLGRPAAWTNLSFSAVMAFLCGYLVEQTLAFSARLPEELVAIERHQFCFTAGLMATLAWFAAEYAGTRLPRWLVFSFYGTIAAFVVVDLVAPYGAYFASLPQLGSAPSAGGELVTTFSAPLALFGGIWIALSGLFLVSVIGVGVRLAIRGERRRGIVLAAAFGMIFLAPLADVFRGVIGGPSVTFGSFGVVGLAIIMSIELAFDFRAKKSALGRAFTQLEERTERLSEMLQTSLTLRDQLNTPLQTMELELTLIDDGSPQLAPRVARLRRALDRLTELGRRLQRSGGEPRA